MVPAWRVASAVQTGKCTEVVIPSPQAAQAADALRMRWCAPHKRQALQREAPTALRCAHKLTRVYFALNASAAASTSSLSRMV